MLFGHICLSNCTFRGSFLDPSLKVWKRFVRLYKRFISTVEKVFRGRVLEVDIVFVTKNCNLL